MAGAGSVGGVYYVIGWQICRLVIVQMEFMTSNRGSAIEVSIYFADSGPASCGIA